MGTIRRRTGRHRRHGVGYVYFLSITMLVTIIGLSSLTYNRIRWRTAQGGDQAIAARFYALSALELGYAAMHLDPDWRTNHGSGEWFTDRAIGKGTLTLAVSIQADGDGNPDNDPVVLVGAGTCGPVTHKIEVTLGAVSARGGLAAAVDGGRRFTN